MDGGSLIIAVGETSDMEGGEGICMVNSSLSRMKMKSYCYCSSPASGTHYSEAGNYIGRIISFCDAFFFLKAFERVLFIDENGNFFFFKLLLHRLEI